MIPKVFADFRKWQVMLVLKMILHGAGELFCKVVYKFKRPVATCTVVLSA